MFHVYILPIKIILEFLSRPRLITFILMIENTMHFKLQAKFFFRVVLLHMYVVIFNNCTNNWL